MLCKQGGPARRTLEIFPPSRESRGQRTWHLLDITQEIMSVYSRLNAHTGNGIGWNFRKQRTICIDSKQLSCAHTQLKSLCKYRNTRTLTATTVSRLGRCRSYGITRWPFRKLKSLERTMKKVQTELEDGNSAQARPHAHPCADAEESARTPHSFYLLQLPSLHFFPSLN